MSAIAARFNAIIRRAHNGQPVSREKSIWADKAARTLIRYGSR